jgi:hypothetical protein
LANFQEHVQLESQNTAHPESIVRQSFFDAGRYKWREVIGDPDLSYKVRHDYTILGHDQNARTLDMVVRWKADGGHCPIHRHTATTTMLVLEGEQHLGIFISTAAAATTPSGPPEALPRHLQVANIPPAS